MELLSCTFQWCLLLNTEESKALTRKSVLCYTETKRLEAIVDVLNISWNWKQKNINLTESTCILMTLISINFDADPMLTAD